MSPSPSLLFPGVWPRVLLCLGDKLSCFVWPRVPLCHRPASQAGGGFGYTRVFIFRWSVWDWPAAFLRRSKGGVMPPPPVGGISCVHHPPCCSLSCGRACFCASVPRFPTLYGHVCRCVTAQPPGWRWVWLYACVSLQAMCVGPLLTSCLWDPCWSRIWVPSLGCGKWDVKCWLGGLCYTARAGMSRGGRRGRGLTVTGSEIRGFYPASAMSTMRVDPGRGSPAERWPKIRGGRFSRIQEGSSGRPRSTPKPTRRAEQ